MATLTESATWRSHIYQLDTTDPDLAGEVTFAGDGVTPLTGHLNAQAKQLADRTTYLKTQVDTAFDDITTLEQDFQAIQGWWNSATSEFGRGFVAAADAAAGRTALGLGDVDNTRDAEKNIGGNAATATKLQTARTLTIGSTGKTFDGSANVSWSLAEIGAVTSSVDTTPGRLLTTDYLDIGKLDKTLWPKATSLLTLKNGPDRTVWVEPDTVDAPNPGFYGKVTCQRLSSTTVIMEAKPLFEAARYTYTFTSLGDSGWVKETMHEVGEWVDLRPYLLSPYFWKSARDGDNHFPQIRLVDRNTVELRGIVSYNASSAAPPNGVAFRVPEGFRPQMTSAGICFADSSSPLWFGQTAYLIQGQVNYSSDPGWANGNVRLLQLSTPNPVADGAVDLSGIRYYLS